MWLGMVDLQNFNGGMKWQIILILFLDVVVIVNVFVCCVGLRQQIVGAQDVKIVTR